MFNKYIICIFDKKSNGNKLTLIKMKHLQFAALCVCFGLLILSGFAHVNYLNALRAASVCCGSDGCIQEAMNGYGFEVDALEVDSPTMAVKVVALWDSTFN